MGRNLYACLPEDAYDRGPQTRGPFSLVADVRLDNRAELIGKLALAPQSDRDCDAALLFEALIKWRERAVDHLVGEFAFAFWDASKHELLLGRDFLGLRPLCFHRGRDFFAFSSMPSGLHALPDVPYGLDVDFMVHALALAQPAGGRSYFEQIMRVEPGRLVRVTKNDIRAQRYWEPAPPNAAGKDSRDSIHALRSLFNEVVKAQLRGAGDVVATQLSAGLDSSAVTATVAREHYPRRVVAFTAVPRAGFDGPAPAGAMADERELAAATARMYSNIDHVLVENSGESPLRWLDHNFHFQQQPVANLANLVWGQEINRQAKERGAKVVFKGALGNLTISYSGMEALPALMAEGRMKDSLLHATALARNGVTLASIGASMIGPFAPPPIWRTLRRVTGREAGLASYSAVNGQRWNQLAADEEKNRVDVAERPVRDPFSSRLAAFRYGDSGGNAYKGALAEWGISVRDPTADRRIVEYCLSLPAEEFIRGGIPRALARRAFSDRLPAEVRDCRRRGCQSADWHEALSSARSEIEQEVGAILRCPEAREALDSSWFRQTLDAWPSGGWHHGSIYRRYRIGLLRAISAGHFMRKVSGTN